MKALILLLPKILQSLLSCEGALISITIQGLSLDSRAIKKGDLFFACVGTQQDGRDHIDQAIERGASAILRETQTDEPPIVWRGNVPIINVDHLNEKVSEMASIFYDYPSQKLLMIGLTGTKGKTSCSHLLANALMKLGQKSAVIGTMGSGIYGEPYDTSCHQTTPDPIFVQALLHRFVEEQVQAVTMEASSHALHQHRVKAVDFKIGVFTNLTRDHFDYHETAENYAAAKHLLFEMPSLEAGVFNLDDPIGAIWAREFQSHYPVCGYTLSVDRRFDELSIVRARSVEFHPRGFTLDLETPWGEATVTCALLGAFNVSNVLAVIAVLGLMHYKLSAIVETVEQFSTVPGRMQLVGGKNNQPLVVIDFAHTPDALEKALQAIRIHCRGKLICVFGCGGNRDRGKRPMMGHIAEMLAEQVIITNDNVRFEDPAVIVQDILAGCAHPEKIRVEHDRRLAIQQAIEQASSEDVILLAGKGHENYQIIGDQYLPFSELEIVRQGLRARRIKEMRSIFPPSDAQGCAAGEMRQDDGLE